MKTLTLIVMCLLAMSLNALRLEDDHETHPRNSKCQENCRRRLAREIIPYLNDAINHLEHLDFTDTVFSMERARWKLKEAY